MKVNGKKELNFFSSIFWCYYNWAIIVHMDKNKNILDIVGFSVPVFLERLVGAYLSIGIVGNVVKSNSKDKLTMQEYAAIETLAYVLWFVGICNGFERIVEKVTAFSNVIVSDILLMILYITIVFIYVFLICALLPVSLFFCLNIFKWINKYLPGKEKLRKYGNIFVQKIENPFKPKSFLIVLIKFIRRKRGINEVMGCILIPFTFMLDVIISVFLAICSIVFSAIGYVFLLGRLIKKTIKRILNRLLSLSDKRVVSASFRIALIISLTCTVVFNRYQPFLKLYEESTTVLEFVASSIIIPVVFEWIYSFKNKTLS